MIRRILAGAAIAAAAFGFSATAASAEVGPTPQIHGHGVLSQWVAALPFDVSALHSVSALETVDALDTVNVPVANNALNNAANISDTGKVAVPVSVGDTRILNTGGN
ncbi:hypothetical protein ACTMTI_33480 [Nonomuraea sp. H19]|uniref:hypothetical protein n=1 Tax=Nonomuraea sp. H19 TaxID=3452206 RepID=UPI003F8B3319